MVWMEDDLIDRCPPNKLNFTDAQHVQQTTSACCYCNDRYKEASSPRLLECGDDDETSSKLTCRLEHACSVQEYIT
jgi:hypothetical protein